MPNRTGLTERAVASHALALIDEEGLVGLSMRKLAGALGVAPMSLYTHFADRDSLLEAVAQLLYAQIDAPTGEDLGPEETVRQIMKSVRRVLVDHPAAVPLVAKYPPRTLDALAFVEAGYRAFRRAGITAHDTARAYRALVAYSLGTATIEVNQYFAAHPAATLPGDSIDTPTLARHLPNVTEVGPLLPQLDDGVEFDYGLELTLAGFMRLQDSTLGSR